MGENIELGPHIEMIRSALGLSPSLGKNNFIRNMSKNKIKNMDKHECFNDKKLMINKMICVWCKSNTECERTEENNSSFEYLVHMDVNIEDKEIIEKELQDILSTDLNPFQTSINVNTNSEISCLPLKNLSSVQPISESQTPFSPNLAYSPALRRNITIFESQILNSLDVKSKSNSDSRFPSCQDFLERITEKNEISSEIINAINSDNYVENGDYYLLNQLIIQTYPLENEGYIEPEIELFPNWNNKQTSGRILNNKDKIRKLTMDFLTEYRDRISEFGNKDNVPFIQNRACGIIFKPKYDQLNFCTSSGVRIIKEVLSTSLSKPYILIDGNLAMGENFNSNKFEYYEDIKSQKKSIKNVLLSKINNEKIIDKFNYYFSESENRSEKWPGISIISSGSGQKLIKSENLDNSIKKNYILFNEYEYFTALSYQVNLRSNLSSYRDANDTIHVERLLSFFRRIGNAAKYSENRPKLMNIGNHFIKKIYDPIYLKRTPLDMIKEICDYNNRYFSDLIEFNQPPRDEYGKKFEQIVFHHYKNNNSQKIIFMREFLYEQNMFSDFNMVSSDLINPLEESSIKKCLIMDNHNNSNKMDIIGGLYLSKEIRKNMIKNNELVEFITNIMHDYCHHNVLVIITENELSVNEHFMSSISNDRFEFLTDNIFNQKFEENILAWVPQTPISETSPVFTFLG